MSSVISGSCFSFHAFKLRVKISWPPLLSLLFIFLKSGSRVRMNKMKPVASLDLSLPPEDYTISFGRYAGFWSLLFMNSFADYFLVFNLFYGKCKRIYCLKFWLGSKSFQGFRNTGSQIVGIAKKLSYFSLQFGDSFWPLWNLVSPPVEDICNKSPNLSLFTVAGSAVWSVVWWQWQSSKSGEREWEVKAEIC